VRVIRHRSVMRGYVGAIAGIVSLYTLGIAVWSDWRTITKGGLPSPRLAGVGRDIWATAPAAALRTTRRRSITMRRYASATGGIVSLHTLVIAVWTVRRRIIEGGLPSPWLAWVRSDIRVTAPVAVLRTTRRRSIAMRRYASATARNGTLGSGVSGDCRSRPQRQESHQKTDSEGIHVLVHLLVRPFSGDHRESGARKTGPWVLYNRHRHRRFRDGMNAPAAQRNLMAMATTRRALPVPLATGPHQGST
jgi:hypothetical protein